MLYDFRRVIFPDPVTLNRFAAVLLVFSFGIFLLSSRLRLRKEHHDHQASVQRWRSFDAGDVRKGLGHQHQFSSAELTVRDLAGAELARDLDLVAVFQELPSLFRLEAEIMLRDARAYLYTLYVLLFFLPLALTLLHVVLEFAVIDDPTNRGNGRGGYHHQVEAFLFGDVEGLPRLKYSELLAV